MDNLTNIVEEAKRFSDMYSIIGQPQGMESMVPQPKPILETPKQTIVGDTASVGAAGGVAVQDALDFDFATPGRPEYTAPRIKVRDPKTQTPVEMDTEAAGAYYGFYQDAEAQGLDPRNNTTLASHLAKPFSPLKQSNSVSCGQTSVAAVINHLTGKNLNDVNVDEKYGFGLLSALNGETEGYRWDDLGDVGPKNWGAIEQRVNDGMPVLVGLNGPEFSPSGRGHIVTVLGIEGEKVLYADPADGSTKTTTKESILNAPSHPDGNFVFGARRLEGKQSSQVEPYQFRVKEPTTNIQKLASKHGYTPVDGDMTLFSYNGTQSKDDGVDDRFISVQRSDGSWNDDKEAAVTMAEEEGINPDIFLNLIQQESGWRTEAVSGPGAFGQTQLMPATALEQSKLMGLNVTIDDIKSDKNLQKQIGLGYLKRQLKEFGNYPQALAAYNAGPGTMQAILKGEASIPEETLDYVKKILKLPDDRLAASLIKDYKGTRQMAQFMDARDSEGKPQDSDWLMQQGAPARKDIKGGVNFVPTASAMGEANATVSNTFESNKAVLEAINGISYAIGASADIVKNAGFQMKKDTAVSVSDGIMDFMFNGSVGSMAAKGAKGLGELVDGVTTMAEGATGQMLGFAKAAGEIVAGTAPFDWAGMVMGVDLKDKYLEAVDAASQFVVGSVLSEKGMGDFNYGKDIGSAQIKNFANTLTLGTFGWGKTDGKDVINSFGDMMDIATGKKSIWGNGQYLSKDEQKSSEAFREGFKKQGGIIGNDNVGTAEGFILDLESGLLENPLMPVALAIQMEAMAALALARPLVAAAEGSGATGMLARGTQNMLNFLGSAGAGAEPTTSAAIAGAKPTLGRMLASPFIKAETAMGILGGTEVFNTSFGKYISDGRMTPGEAFIQSSIEGTFAAGLGFAFGLGSKFVGTTFVGPTVKGMQTMGAELASKPAVQGSKIYSYVKGAGETLSKVPIPTVAKQARGLLSKLGKEIETAIEAHAGGMAERFKAAKFEDEYRDAKRISYKKNTNMAQSLEQEKLDLTETFTKAESEYKVAEQAKAEAIDFYEKVKSGDPTDSITQVEHIRESLQSERELHAKYEARIAELEPRAEGNPVITQAVESLNKDLENTKKSIRENVELSIKLLNENVKPYLETASMKMGLQEPLTLKGMQESIEKATKAVAEHPAQEILAARDLFEADNKVRSYTIDILKQQAEKDLAIADGYTEVPPAVDLNYEWSTMDEALSAADIRRIVQHSSEDVSTSLPWETRVELTNKMREMGDPRMRSPEFLKEYTDNLGKFVANIKDPAEKKFYGDKVAAMSKSLESAGLQGQAMQDVTKELAAGGEYHELIKGLLKASPRAQEVLDTVDSSTLSQLMVQDETVKRSLIAKLGLAQGEEVPMGKYQKLSAELQAQGNLKTPEQEVKDMGIAIASLVRSDDEFSASLKSKSPELHMSMQNTASAQNMMGDTLKTMAYDAQSLVKGSGKYMAGSTKAFGQVGTMFEALAQRNIKKGLDRLTARVSKEDFDASNFTLTDFVKKSTDADGVETNVFDRDGVQQYIADSIFEGSDALGTLVKEVPELREAIMPLLQIDSYFKQHELMTPDMMDTADGFYLGNYLPRTHAYKKADGNVFPKRLLVKHGIIDKDGKLVMKGEDLTKKARAAEEALGGMAEWNEYLNMSPTERAEVLRASGHTQSLDFEEAESITAALLVGDRMSDPGELLKARVESLGHAESQRKFLDRMTMFMDESNKPLVYVRTDPKAEVPTGYRSIGQSRVIETKEYYLMGGKRQASDIFMTDAAADLMDKFHSEIPSWKGEEKYVEFVRLQNALALGGPHLPFLGTIGSNMWQMMGFNMARLGEGFNIRNQFTGEGEFARVIQTSQLSGLNLQTIENNALALGQDFLKDSPQILADSSKELLNQPHMWAATKQLMSNIVKGARDSDGVGEAAFKAAVGSAKGLRNFDEFLMEHMLFQNLRDAQIAAWMHKSIELEHQMKLDGTSMGLTPAEIRSMARREAATLVNTFAGTADSGAFSSGMKKALRYIAMTPQFFGARVRSIQGAISESTFREYPKASRQRLVSEHRWMLGKMAVATGLSAFAMQYMMTGTTPLDNGEGNMFSVMLPNGKMISNPMGAYINTVSKLTGTQEMARGIGNSLRAQLVDSFPSTGNIPGMKPSEINMPTTAGTILSQPVKQLHNLAAPGPKAAMTAQDLPDSAKYNPMSAGEQLGRAISSDIGMVQMLTNKDPFTGAPREPWERAPNLAGAYVRDDNRIKDFGRKWETAKKESLESLRGQVQTTLNMAFKQKDPTKRNAMIDEAWKLADPYRQYYDEGGVAVGKGMRKAFQLDPSMHKDGRMRLTPDVWDSIVSRANNKDAYDYGLVSKKLRPFADDFREQKAAGGEFVENRGGELGKGFRQGVEGM